MHYSVSQQPGGESRFLAIARPKQIRTATATNAGQPDPIPCVVIEYGARAMAELQELLEQMADDDLHTRCVICVREIAGEPPVITVMIRQNRPPVARLKHLLAGSVDPEELDGLSATRSFFVVATAAALTSGIDPDFLPLFKQREVALVVVHAEGHSQPVRFLTSTVCAGCC